MTGVADVVMPSRDVADPPSQAQKAVERRGQVWTLRDVLWVMLTRDLIELTDRASGVVGVDARLQLIDVMEVLLLVGHYEVTRLPVR